MFSFHGQESCSLWFICLTNNQAWLHVICLIPLKSSIVFCFHKDKKISSRVSKFSVVQVHVAFNMNIAGMTCLS